MLFIALISIVLYCMVLYCIVLYCIVWHRIALYCMVLYCINYCISRLQPNSIDMLAVFGPGFSE